MDEEDEAMLAAAIELSLRETSSAIDSGAPAAQTGNLLLIKFSY